MISLILRTTGVVVMVIWAGLLSYLTLHCSQSDYSGPDYRRSKLTLDHSVPLTEIESCVTHAIWQLDGKRGARIFWNAPLLGMGIFIVGYHLPRRRGHRDPLDKDEVRQRARRRL